MQVLKTIQYKALFLLVAFTANFFVVCHCSAMTAPAQVQHHHQHSCCGKENVAGGKCAAGENATHDATPCDKGNCRHAQAIKFNLLEKQLAHQVTQPPLYTIFINRDFILPVNESLEKPHREITSGQWPGTHSPPDLHALYQRFLI
jgi:hypothetical protein